MRLKHVEVGEEAESLCLSNLNFNSFKSRDKYNFFPNQDTLS